MVFSQAIVTLSTGFRGSSQSTLLSATHSFCWGRPEERGHKWLLRTPGHHGKCTEEREGQQDNEHADQECCHQLSVSLQPLATGV